MLPIIWFYAFFDANNKNSTEDEEFYQIEDDYLFHIEQFKDLQRLWDKHGNIFIALLLIFGGIYLLIHPIVYWFMDSNFLTVQQRDIFWTFYDRIPQFLLAVVIIVLGIRLIRGKKQEYDKIDQGRDFDGKTY